VAYIVFKSGFWRRRPQLALRDVHQLDFGFFKWTSTKEKYIRKDKVLVVLGGLGAGKTRELSKLAKRCQDVFGQEGVFIAVGESLTNWYKRAGLSSQDLKGLSQFEKNELLIERCKGKVVFLDDLDRADGKVKVDVLKWLIRVADRVVVSARDLKRVNPSLEFELRRKLKLKDWEGFPEGVVVDLGKRETEVRDVGLLVGIVLVVFVAMSWGLTQALLGALAMRWIVAEARQNK